MPLSTNSSSEKLRLIKEAHENYRIQRLKEFQRRCFLKDCLANDRQKKVIDRIKESTQRSRKKHEEAAERRKRLEEEKRKKIEHRRSQSEERRNGNNSITMLKQSSIPGVFVNAVTNVSERKGKAGFGNVIDRLDPDISFHTRNGEVIVNTSVYRKYPDKKMDVRRNKRTQKLAFVSNSELSEAKSLTEGSVDYSHLNTLDILSDQGFQNCTHGSDECSSNLMSSSLSGDVIHSPINLKKGRPEKCSPLRCKSMRNMKKVTFQSEKADTVSPLENRTPAIKQALHLRTPETKKGILMKMSELCAKRKKHLSIPESVSKSDISSENCAEGDVINKTIQDKIDVEDNVLICVASPEFDESPRQISTLPIKMADIEFTSDYTQNQHTVLGKVLKHCENDKKHRKQRLALLQQELKNIEEKTKQLSNENAVFHQKWSNTNTSSEGKSLGLFKDDSFLEMESKAKLFATFLKNRFNFGQGALDRLGSNSESIKDDINEDMVTSLSSPPFFVNWMNNSTDLFTIMASKPDDDAELMLCNGWTNKLLGQLN